MRMFKLETKMELVEGTILQRVAGIKIFANSEEIFSGENLKREISTLISKAIKKEYPFLTVEIDNVTIVHLCHYGDKITKIRTRSDLTPYVEHTVEAYVFENNQHEITVKDIEQLNRFLDTLNSSICKILRSCGYRKPHWKEGVIRELNAASIEFSEHKESIHICVSQQSPIIERFKNKFKLSTIVAVGDKIVVKITGSKRI